MTIITCEHFGEKWNTVLYTNQDHLLPQILKNLRANFPAIVCSWERQVRGRKVERGA